MTNALRNALRNAFSGLLVFSINIDLLSLRVDKLCASTRARSLQVLRELVERLEGDYAAPAKQANLSLDLDAGKICKSRHRDR